MKNFYEMWKIVEGTQGVANRVRKANWLTKKAAGLEDVPWTDIPQEYEDLSKNAELAAIQSKNVDLKRKERVLVNDPHKDSSQNAAEAMRDATKPTQRVLGALLSNAVRNGDLEKIKMYLSQSKNPKSDIKHAYNLAVGDGKFFEIVKFLGDQLEPQKWLYNGIIGLSREENPNMDIFNYAIKKIDLNDKEAMINIINNLAITKEEGFKSLKFFLDHTNISDEMLKYLLKQLSDSVTRMDNENPDHYDYFDKRGHRETRNKTMYARDFIRKWMEENRRFH